MSDVNRYVIVMILAAQDVQLLQGILSNPSMMNFFQDPVVFEKLQEFVANSSDTPESRSDGKIQFVAIMRYHKL